MFTYNISIIMSGKLYQNNNYRTDDPAPINWHMGEGIIGSYAGLRLKPAGVSSWRKYPNDAPLKKNPLFVPQGTPLPLKNEEIYQNIPDDSMFMFAKNYASPACCPATYSTSTGCVCTTPEQRSFVGARRGNNKNFCSDPDY